MDLKRRKQCAQKLRNNNKLSSDLLNLDVRQIKAGARGEVVTVINKLHR